MNHIVVELASKFESQLGIQKGTRESAEAIRFTLLNHIQETEDALDVLTDDKHSVPKYWLRLSLNYYREALVEVETKLDQGDYLT